MLKILFLNIIRKSPNTNFSSPHLEPPTAPVLGLNGRSISSTANLPEFASSLFEQSSSNANKESSEFKTTDAYVSSTSSRLSLKEKHLITVDCLQLAWTTPKHGPHWFVAGINLTEQAQLYMEFLTDQQVYKVRSSLTFNVTKEMHRGHLVCETEHANWPNAQSMATIELDVQCKWNGFNFSFNFYIFAPTPRPLS